MWFKTARLGLGVLCLTVPAMASADLLQSSHFRLDPNVGSSFGGTNNSASYHLTASGGEAVAGSGSSTSYKLSQGYISHLPHALQLSVMPTGIFSYYPLDTGTGAQIYDVSTTGNQAIAQNSPSWTAGQISQSLNLNGTTQYLSTSVSQVNPNPLSIELWFKTSSVSGGVLAGFSDVKTGAGTISDRNLYMTPGGQLIFGVHSGSYKTISTTAAYNDGTWHHVAATLGSSGLTLGVDGSLKASDATTTTGNNFTGFWRFGFGDITGWPSAGASNFINAQIDELKIFTTEINTSQIQVDYNAGLAHQRFGHALPRLLSGTSSSYSVDAIVQTDAGGYDLNLQALSLLTHTNNVKTIPMMSGTVASPTAWTEGVTQGLGFTLTGGPQIEAKWGTGPTSYNYAGVPLAATTFHSRTGLSGGVPEKSTLQYRVDTSSTQAPGTYTTTIIYTATLKP